MKNKRTEQRRAWRAEWATGWTWVGAKHGHRPPLIRKQRRANWRQEWKDRNLPEQ